MSKNFVIVISRTFGSGGRRIGEILSEKLGISLYDKTILGMVAEEKDISDQRLREMDEYLNAHRFTNVGLQLKKGILGAAYLFETHPDGIIDREKVYEWQCDVIRRLAEKGPCIIVGRCADEVLKDHPGLIKLFITAPKSVREDRIKALYPNIPAERKQSYREYVSMTDRLRTYYYNYHTGKDWDDIRRHDLIIDSSCLGIEETAAFLEEYVRRRVE